MTAFSGRRGEGPRTYFTGVDESRPLGGVDESRGIDGVDESQSFDTYNTPSTRTSPREVPGGIAAKIRESVASDSLSMTEPKAEQILGAKMIIARKEIQILCGEQWFRDHEISKIPFSKEDLEAAKTYGASLIYRPDEVAEGEPVTARRMLGLVNDYLQKNHRPEIVLPAQYMTWPAMGENIQAGWALVATTPPPDANMRTYAEQTRWLRAFAAKNYATRPDQAIANTDGPTISSLEVIIRAGKKGMTSGAQAKDYDEAVNKLHKLDINQLLRRSVGEAIVDAALLYAFADKKIYGDRDMEWTKTKNGNKFLAVGIDDSNMQIRLHDLSPNDTSTRVYPVWTHKK